ncbi:MAG TPA: hypothetical protein VLY24_30315 [Bryobacteraceae bacterium]|nr:hypothetical protein [Bryobacteraceae bacterium]
MRVRATLAILGLLPSISLASNNLTVEDRIELTRGLMSEFANVKVLLPRSKKPLDFDVNGTWDKKAWEEAAKQFGAAARNGDQIQITRIAIQDDAIVFEINGGIKSGRKWYDGIQVGVGTTNPVPHGDRTGSAGTYIALEFHKPLDPIKSAEVKKILAPIFDFDRHSATELYVDTLPPEVKQAISEKRVTVGMTHEQVLLAVGRPTHKSRETDKEGNEEEDWVFGQPPGKISFVTFHGDKVVKVKDEYAGLGTEVADPKVPR